MIVVIVKSDDDYICQNAGAPRESFSSEEFLAWKNSENTLKG